MNKMRPGRLIVFYGINRTGKMTSRMVTPDPRIKVTEYRKNEDLDSIILDFVDKNKYWIY